MLAEQNKISHQSLVVSRQSISFVKMNGAGNDFVIFDAREEPLFLAPEQIKKISNRKNVGCDQVIVLRNSLKADVLMEIYNSDGSLSGACGNATRCVASILFSEEKSDETKIETAAGILKCWKNGELISVDMGIPTFEAQKIPTTAKNSDKIKLNGFNFSCVNVGNPHAVTFVKEPLADKKFFDVGSKVETNEIFLQKTNVEFAQILSDDLIEVRVWERGAGETLACGTGACAVGILAIKKGLIKENKVVTRFKGGDLQIEWNGEGSSVVMTGGYEKIFEGVLDASFNI
jgi:diaminopimelate epimerase